ncbi:MAG: helix-turn-helix transcriptional regulator [Lachnospiraceae bacterium]|nr:helix-turn-helix transcriptional regulator [Lachnospiraceae bacterium]
MSEKNIRYPHIRDLREDADLSQADLARILNCSQVAYSYYEIGRRDIPTEVLIALSKFYDCSVDYLLGLSNTKR